MMLAKLRKRLRNAVQEWLGISDVRAKLSEIAGTQERLAREAAKSIHLDFDAISDMIRELEGADTTWSMDGKRKHVTKWDRLNARLDEIERRLNIIMCGGHE